MTAENLDTLRHETIHLIQDCRDGKLDGQMNTVLQPGRARSLLVASNQDPNWIHKVYSSHGQADAVPFEEEAFGAAATMSADTIHKALDIICPVE